LTANLPGGTLRASRLSKRPLTQARHIRQQALFALRDSDAEGRAIERLTVELSAPERVGLQQGIWPQRERRTRAFEATLERFPHAPRRLTWRDPHAQAGDLAWDWLAPSASDSSEALPAAVDETGGSTGVAARQAARKAARVALVSAASFRAAGEAAAVPLFSGAAADSPAQLEEFGAQQAGSGPASYPDLLFAPPAHSADVEIGLGRESDGGPGINTQTSDSDTDSDQPPLFPPRVRQHYTEPFVNEEPHASTADTRHRDSRQSTAARSGLVRPPDQAAA